MAQPRLFRRPRVFYGWWVVAAGFYADLILAGAAIWAFGVFIVPISEDTHWSTTAVTLVVTMRTLATGVVGPFIGPLLDRRGTARWVMTVGALIGGISFIAGGLSHSLWQLYLSLGILGALGTQASGLFSASTVISKWFVRYRGRAIGILTVGISAAGFLLVPPLRFLIEAWGWRAAMIALGMLVLATLVPVTWAIVRGSPEEIGLQPDGAAMEASTTAAQDPEKVVPLWARERSWTLKEALKTRALWILVLGQNLGSLGSLALVVHLLPYLQRDKGFSPAQAATIFAVYGLGASLSRIPWGLLAERFPVRFAMGFSFGGTGVGLALVMASHGLVQTTAAAAVLGTATGGFAMLLNLVWPEYYGRRYVGTIRGFIAPLNLISSSGGPLLAAWVYDATHSYSAAFSAFVVVLLLSGLVLSMAKPPKAPTPSTMGPYSTPL